MEKKIVCLWKLLKDKGDLLLNGKAKLCLELDELIHLSQFKLPDKSCDFVTVNNPSTSICTILDFIQKTIAVKIVGNDSVCQFISFEQFKQIKYVELYNVPVEIIINVEYLKDNLRHITLHRSCTDLCSFLVSEEETRIWKTLSRAIFCFNNITKINEKLSSMIPYVKVLDLSHNNLRDLGDTLNHLQCLEFLGISFNLLEDIPIISSPNFKTLVARSNNIKMLDGFFEMEKVINIDVRDNCLEYLEQLNPLSHLNKIQSLKLSGNPISFNIDYRKGVLKELSHHLNADSLYLDGVKISLDEYAYLRIPSSYNRITVTQLSKFSRLHSNNLISDTINTRKNSVSEKVEVSAKIRRSPKKQRAIVAEEYKNTVKINAGLIEDLEVAKSMKDRYQGDWVSWFDVRDTNTIVPEIDLDNDLEDIIKNIDTFVVEEDDPEIDLVPDETAQNQNPVVEVIDSAEIIAENPDVTAEEIADHIDNQIADSSSDDEEHETVHEFQDLPQHFVTSADVDLFVTISNETLIERDIIGQLVQKMDINCLTNFIDDETTVKLYFNHVLEDRKYRLYEFNNNTELRSFLSKIEEIWRRVRDKNVVLDEVKCLNCNHICYKSMVDDACIACGNQALIPITHSILNTPVQTPVSGTPLEQLMSLNLSKLIGSGSDAGQSMSDQGSVKTDKLKPEDGSDMKSTVSSTHSSSHFSISSSKSMFITQNNFVTADHQLELYMEVKLFQRNDEVKCCYLFCQYAKYGKQDISNALLVVSNYLVYICKVVPPQKLVLKSRHRLAKLKYLDIGLNKQHFKMEWASQEASYKFLVYDDEKCSSFVEILTLALPDTTQISYISNSTVSSIHELVFGIDKSLELAAKGKRYHHVLSNATDKFMIQDRTVLFKTYNKCIAGSDLVEWLIDDGECDNRAEAVDLCQQLLLVDIIHHVKCEEQFHDDSTLYRFSVDEDGYSTQQDYVIQENLNKEIMLYQLCYVVDKRDPEPISLILSNVKVFLTHEYHQWPLPRLQAPLPLQLRGQHFQVLHEIDITDISMVFKKTDTLTFTTQNKTYDIRFVNEKTSTSVLGVVCQLWEDLLGFPLQVNDL